MLNDLLLVMYTVHYGNIYDIWSLSGNDHGKCSNVF